MANGICYGLCPSILQSTNAVWVPPCAQRYVRQRRTEIHSTQPCPTFPDRQRRQPPNNVYPHLAQLGHLSSTISLPFFFHSQFCKNSSQRETMSQVLLRRSLSQISTPSHPFEFLLWNFCVVFSTPRKCSLKKSWKIGWRHKRKLIPRHYWTNSGY